MKVKIGYITAWRKTFFWSVIFMIFFFGLASTLAGSLIGEGLVSNVIGMFAFLGGIVLCLLVYSDRNDSFTDYGMASFEREQFDYRDKKQKFSIKYSDIKKLDIQQIKIQQNSRAFAYKILIQTEKKLYFIESDRALGREYNEMDIYNLYLEIQKKINGGK